MTNAKVQMPNPGSINPSDLTTGREYQNTLMIAAILAPYYPERSEGLVRGQVQNPNVKIIKILFGFLNFDIDLTLGF